MKIQTIPGYRRVCICYEQANGDFAHRYVQVLQTSSDSEDDLRRKAADTYRARWGHRQRVVSINLYPQRS